MKRITEDLTERTAWWQSFLDDGPIDVSVCIVNWNCRDLLRNCLESLHDQPQGVRFETIVVDNGSHDGAAEMVAREFPEVRLVRNPINAGFSKANNQAAQLARGRYLFFLNNDTVVPAGTLRRLADFADAHPELGMIGPLLRDGEGNKQYSHRRRPTLATFLYRTGLLRWLGLFRPGYHQYRREDLDPRQPHVVDVLMGAAMFLPRSIFFDSGRWDEDYFFGGEDFDLCHRVGQRHPVVFLPQVEITHLGRAGTRQNLDAATAIEIGFVRYLRKTSCPPLGLLAYKLLLTLDAPLQILAKGLQYLWRRATGQRIKAEKSLLVARSVLHFLWHGLGPFWKA